MVRPPEIHILHRSDFYSVRDYKCYCLECSTSKTEYTKSFLFCFVRSGFFEYQDFRRNHEVHIGRMLILKPDFEHITHHIDNQPDICSVFDFTPAFVESLTSHYQKEAGWFFQNRDIQSILLQCNGEIDFLHQQILNLTSKAKGERLLIDDLTIQLVNRVMSILGNAPDVAPITEALKKHHLSTVEMARDYIFKHFNEDVSLQLLSDHCCVSLFHFSRIFKSVMGMSPHQYLTDVRLQHAKSLLQSCKLPVTQIAFQCGFNSLEHFVSAYRLKFKTTPSAFRKSLA
jgi:AraC family transcriptional regulator